MLSGLPPSFEARSPAGQRIELARQAYLMGLAIDPQSASLHNTAALVEAEDARFDVAVREITAAVELQPTFAEAHLNMGALALRLRDFPRAERAYHAAIALLPQSYDAHLGLAVALRSRLEAKPSPEDAREVEAELDTCKALDSSRPEAFFNKVWLLHDTGYWADRHPENFMEEIRHAWFDALDRSAADPWYHDVRREADRWFYHVFGHHPPEPRLVGQCPAGLL